MLETIVGGGGYAALGAPRQNARETIVLETGTGAGTRYQVRVACGQQGGRADRYLRSHLTGKYNPAVQEPKYTVTILPKGNY